MKKEPKHTREMEHLARLYRNSDRVSKLAKAVIEILEVAAREGRKSANVPCGDEDVVIEFLESIGADFYRDRVSNIFVASGWARMRAYD